jgi:hypothetical protein
MMSARVAKSVHVANRPHVATAPTTAKSAARAHHVATTKVTIARAVMMATKVIVRLVPNMQSRLRVHLVPLALNVFSR